jgi:hypothetical protein
MRQALRTFAVALAVLPLGYIPARAGSAEVAVGAGAPCVAVRTEARYGAVGYNHVVILRNRCDMSQLCTVSTNVNPVPQSAPVPPRAEVEVVTFLGSPASVFVANVECHAK